MVLPMTAMLDDSSYDMPSIIIILLAVQVAIATDPGFLLYPTLTTWKV